MEPLTPMSASIDLLERMEGVEKRITATCVKLMKEKLKEKACNASFIELQESVKDIGPDQQLKVNQLLMKPF